MKINAHNAPAFIRHLETLRKLTGNPETPPYPFDLVKQIKRLEIRANRIATADCNGTIDPELADKKLDKIKEQVQVILPELKTLFINGDPRGYSLKIKEEEAKQLGIWQDWGGYGILSPEF